MTDNIKRRMGYSPFGNALLRIRDGVSLQQSMNTLMKSEDGTQKAVMLEYIIGEIHGKDVFLQEVEKLAKTSTDKERWEAMRKRIGSKH